jgi:hypothetical protein
MSKVANILKNQLPLSDVAANLSLEVMSEHHLL